MRSTLAGADTDPAFTAEALLLPGEAFLADQMVVVDPDSIHTARDLARKAIGQALKDVLRQTYDRMTDTGPYTTDGLAVGKRALRNTCLGYLSATEDAEAIVLAKAQFDAGRNMTDVLAALSVLAATESAERVQALATFHAAWKDDALVLDKWFAIQAMSPRASTLRDVRALLDHPDFDLRNPNRARSLVASFPAGNQVRFHAADGGGYDFLADMIIRIDPANGQLAARMVAPLGQWRRFDTGRQEKMKQALRRVLALPNLTTNTYEMVSKSLA